MSITYITNLDSFFLSASVYRILFSFYQVTPYQYYGLAYLLKVKLVYQLLFKFFFLSHGGVVETESKITPLVIIPAAYQRRYLITFILSNLLHPHSVYYK